MGNDWSGEQTWGGLGCRASRVNPFGVLPKYASLSKYPSKNIYNAKLDSL